MSDAGAVATARVACKHHAPPSCTTAGIGEKAMKETEWLQEWGSESEARE